MLDVQNIISREDISQIIESKIGSAKYELVKYEFKSLSEIKGMMGVHLILNVTIKTNKEENLSFFAKLIPQNDIQRNIVLNYGIFKKEFMTYKLFEEIKTCCKNLNGCIANCYLSRINSFLIFDNLIETGYRVLGTSVNYEVMEAIIKCLALIHASSISYEEQQTKLLGRKYRLLQEFPELFKEGMFNADHDESQAFMRASIKGLHAEIDIYKQPEILLNGKNFKHAAADLCYKIYELVKPSQKMRNVISHGDIWFSNILIKESTKIEAKFVDYQNTRYCPPAHDVMSAIFLTTTRDFRKKYLHKLLATYYEFLKNYLNDNNIDVSAILTYEEFLVSCEEQKKFAALQAAFYFPVILLERNDFAFLINNELFEKVYLEDKSLLFTLFKGTNYYKKRLEESILDIKDVCEMI